MTAKVGYFDPILNRELTAGEVAAIAVVQRCFYIEESETLNRDCLNLWNTIQEWSEEGKEFVSLNDFIQTIRQQGGFSGTFLCTSDVFNQKMYFADYIEYMGEWHCNILSVL
jgi:hypothetical protein